MGTLSRDLRRLAWAVRLGAILVALAALAACAYSPADRLVGRVDTTEQRVYRAAGIYHVVAGLACEYVKTPTALPGASARVAQAGDAAWQALVEARAYSAFGEDSIAALASLSGALTALAGQALEVSVDAPDMDAGGLAGYATERALQVAVGYVHLRSSLAVLRGDLSVMVSERRDPTDAEWSEVMDAAEAARDCLAHAGGAR
ncbi:hypothetical protein F1188_19385 [Roseospira marina]|uniref:Lipoprotein n=1 Tax=Roseospira marina TaxID=140057 RepID=A0A5M6I681_9PROT|nr:hypothetical protein [Roseospira marina]KAA5603760.1 hypothetical protein F1188_19385 [Roseospira marina]MBB4316049.1 hypothetical protein [Roseospira marina]MBB5089233.1 hypothetical protein [Roseospira marina]